MCLNHFVTGVILNRLSCRPYNISNFSFEMFWFLTPRQNNRLCAEIRMEVFESKSLRYIFTLEMVSFYKHATNSSKREREKKNKDCGCKYSWRGFSILSSLRCHFDFVLIHLTHLYIFPFYFYGFWVERSSDYISFFLQTELK